MFWKSLIGALTINSATTLSVIPTVSTIATNNIKNVKSVKNSQTYNILFKEISTIDGSNVKVIPETDRSFYLHSNAVIGASGLPSNFYTDGSATIYFANQTVWDQVGSVYGYDSSTDRFVISNLMSKILFLMFRWQIVQGFFPFP